MDVKAYSYCHGTDRFIFVDTPGFNSSQLNNVVLKKIARYLDNLYVVSSLQRRFHLRPDRHRQSVELTGVIYTHRINTSHTRDAQLTGLRIFAALCGDEAADRARLVTTMWDEVNVDDVVATENTIRAEWKLLLDAGSRYERFDNTGESAWNIVRGLGGNRKTLLLQRELVSGMKLTQTTAGRQLLLGISQDIMPSFPVSACLNVLVTHPSLTPPGMLWIK